MRAAFPISKFHDLAQHPNQHGRIVLLLTDLPGHQLHQTPLLFIELDGICHTAVHDPRIERAVHIIRSSKLIRFTDHHLRVIAGDHDDRNIFDDMVCIHGFQYPKPIQFRHIDIQKYQRDLLLILI